MEYLGISPHVMEQGRLFLTGILGGAIVAFFYDLLRLWRRLIHHGVVWMALEDVGFFFVWAVVGFLVLYPQSLGQLRGFLLLALAIGAMGYHVLISPRLMRGGTFLVGRLRGIGLKLKKALHSQEIPLKNTPK